MRAVAWDADAVRALIARSMAYWPRDAGYSPRPWSSCHSTPTIWSAMRRGSSRMGRRPSASTASRSSGHSAEIEEFHLEPDRIGHGFGRTMFEHAVGRARERGVTQLEWSCDEYALGFYLAMGGQVTGSVPSGIAGDEPSRRWHCGSTSAIGRSQTGTARLCDGRFVARRNGRDRRADSRRRRRGSRRGKGPATLVAWTARHVRRARRRRYSTRPPGGAHRRHNGHSLELARVGRGPSDDRAVPAGDGAE